MSVCKVVTPDPRAIPLHLAVTVALRRGDCGTPSYCDGRAGGAAEALGVSRRIGYVTKRGFSNKAVDQSTTRQIPTQGYGGG